MFSSISSNDLDYRTAYRTFSIGINEALTYSVVNNAINNESYKKNDLFKYLISQLNTISTRLHIICYWDNDTTIYQLITYLRELTTLTKVGIYVHLIMNQKSLNDYRNIEKNLNSLNYEIGNNVKIGIIGGADNNLLYKDFNKMLVAESGEKWKDITKKVSTLYDTRTIPSQTRVFALNDGFALNDNDSILFFNYSNINVTPYTKELIEQRLRQLNLGTIKFYSLFPVKSENVNIPHLYDYAVSSTYTLNSLKSIGAKCMVMAKKDYCININNYLTGLRNIFDNDLKYMPTDNGFIYDGPTLLNVISSLKEELVIVNFEIDDCKTVEEIKDRLYRIDSVIGTIYGYTSQNNMGLFISSLYGLERQMYNVKHELCKINFSTRVPVVVADASITKKNYIITEGNVYDLANSVYKNINSQYKIEGIVQKKKGLLSIFKK